MTTVELPSEISGECHPGFTPVARLLSRQIRRSGGGAAVCVYHRGEKLVDLWGGVRDATGNPWQRDTLSVSFSTSKGVTATALHALADRGLVDYDAPVARYWPEFAQGGKQGVSVRHILSHTAGLYRIRDYVDRAERVLDWSYMTDALACARPAHEPGTMSGYHAITFGWLVGEIVQRVTGKPFSEVVERELALPLGLQGLFIGAPESAIPRAAQLLLGPRAQRSPEALRPRARRLHRALRALRIPIDLEAMASALVPRGMEGLRFDSPETLRVPIPAANGLFDARSLARLYAALAGGGVLDGVRLLSSQTLARATEVQTRRLDRVIPLPMHWRLGYHRAMTTRGSPRRAFGHYGFGGSGAWADPERNLAMALVLNSGLGTPFGDLRTARMGAVVLRCADRRSG